MARVAIQIKGIDDLLEKARRLPDNVRQELDNTLLEETYNIAAIAKFLAPTDTGRLRSSIVAEQVGLSTRTGEGLRYQVRAKASKYAVYVEFGRRPGRQPPIKALMPWVRRVIRPPRKRLRSVAFLVARAIGRRGIEARPFMRTAYEQREHYILYAIREALRRGVQR